MKLKLASSVRYRVDGLYSAMVAMRDRDGANAVDVR